MNDISFPVSEALGIWRPRLGRRLSALLPPDSSPSRSCAVCLCLLSLYRASVALKSPPVLQTLLSLGEESQQRMQDVFQEIVTAEQDEERDMDR